MVVHAGAQIGEGPMIASHHGGWVAGGSGSIWYLHVVDEIDRMDHSSGVLLRSRRERLLGGGCLIGTDYCLAEQNPRTRQAFAEENMAACKAAAAAAGREITVSGGLLCRVGL